MRTADQIYADSRDEPPFSNATQAELPVPTIGDLIERDPDAPPAGPARNPNLPNRLTWGIATYTTRDYPDGTREWVCHLCGYLYGSRPCPEATAHINRHTDEHRNGKRDHD